MTCTKHVLTQEISVASLNGVAMCMSLNGVAMCMSLNGVAMCMY